MNGHPYLAILFGALLASVPGAKVFGSKTGGALTAVLVFAFFAGLRAVLLSVN